MSIQNTNDIALGTKLSAFLLYFGDYQKLIPI